MEVPHFEYNEDDFIFSTQSWEEFHKSPSKTEFDKLLGLRWEKAMDAGVFNYKLKEEDKKIRIVPGEQKYVLALSLSRAQKRRQPEFIDSVNQPFNPNKFHFNKIRSEEIIMQLNPARERKDEAHDCENGIIKSEKSGKHLLIINASPFEYGHVLLTPDVDLCIPQKVTLRGIRVALEMMLLSGHPGFRVAFNGLCALASVNHQHVHGWYLDKPLRLESAAVKQVSGLCYEMTDLPSHGFVFQLDRTTVSKLARAIFAVTNYFQENDIAHNIFMVRGTVFGDETRSTLRVCLWPRKHFVGDKSELEAQNAVAGIFNVAAAELAGHVPMYYAERFDDLTEGEIIGRIQDQLLSEEEFSKISAIVCKLMDQLEEDYKNGCS